MHLKIQIALPNVFLRIVKEPLYYPYIEDLFKYLISLGYAEKVDEKRIALNYSITKNLIVDDEHIYIAPFWQGLICRLYGGVNKGDFVRLQLIAYELLELWSAGMFKFEIEGWTPCLDTDYFRRLSQRDQESKEIIRRMKRSATKTNLSGLYKCGHRAITPSSGNILACCVCRAHPIKLLKKL